MPTTRLVRRIRTDFDDGSADGVIDGLLRRIVRDEDRVDWTDIGWQVNYEESFVPEPHIGPFAFSRLSYEATLTDALHRYEELAGR